MARSRSSSSSSWFRYVNPAYYLKRPKRLALLFIFFVFGSLLVWDRQTLVREHEVIYLFSALPFVILTYLCLSSTPMTFAIVLLLKANGSNLNVEHCFSLISPILLGFCWKLLDSKGGALRVLYLDHLQEITEVT